MKPIAQQIVLVTGSTDGLGKSTAHALARQGATVLLHGRDQQRLAATQQEIREATGNAKIETYLADFASIEQVRQLGLLLQKDHPHLDLLINNAGIGGGNPARPIRELSQDGYELRFAVNYLASFLLTNLLLPSLRQGAPSRIVNVASVGQSPINFADVMLERRYDPMQAYSQSKLAQIMFTFDLAERLKGDHITVTALHPATFMNTKMVYESVGYALSTVEDGLKAVMNLATSPRLDGVTGKYFDQLRESRANGQAYNAAARHQLWQLSEELTGAQW